MIVIYYVIRRNQKMRTDTQKKFDKKRGLKDVIYKFNPQTGKIDESAKLIREYDPLEIEKGIIAYREQVKEIQEQVKRAEEALEGLKDIENDPEVQKFSEMITKVNKLKQKEQNEKTLATKKDELQYHLDNIADQEALVEEYKQWSKHNVVKKD